MRSLLPLCVLALLAVSVLAGCDRSAPVATGSPADVTLIPPPSRAATGSPIDVPYPAGTPVGQAVPPAATGVATQAPLPAATPAPQATPSPAANPPAQSQTFAYIVQVGDTLQSIATKFNTTVEVLRALNNLGTDQVTVGQQLIIPGTAPANPNNPPANPTPTPKPAATVRTVRYVVKPGDRLYRIGLRYGVSWETIARYNGITNPKLIQPFDVLLIPLP